RLSLPLCSFHAPPTTEIYTLSLHDALPILGDMYIVNKSDLEGAAALYHTIVDLIGDTERKPTVVKASAKTGKGIRELAKSIDKRSEEHTSELQSRENLVCRLLLEKKNRKTK